jgi:hypothetical protein
MPVSMCPGHDGRVVAAMGLVESRRMRPLLRRGGPASWLVHRSGLSSGLIQGEVLPGLPSGSKSISLRCGNTKRQPNGRRGRTAGSTAR